MRTALVRIALAAALLSGTARGQATQETWVSSQYPGKIFIVNWEISGPIGSFSNYTNDVGLRGGSFEFSSFLKRNLSLGVSFSWNRFYQTFDNVQVPITNGVASGPVFRSANFFAVRGIAHYYVNREGPLKPYLGVGIGGLYNYSLQQIADLSNSQENFNFVVSPEVGALYWFSSTAALNVAFRYTWTNATVGREKDIQMLSGIIGVAFGY